MEENGLRFVSILNIRVILLCRSGVSAGDGLRSAIFLDNATFRLVSYNQADKHVKSNYKKEMELSSEKMNEQNIIRHALITDDRSEEQKILAWKILRPRKHERNFGPCYILSKKNVPRQLVIKITSASTTPIVSWSSENTMANNSFAVSWFTRTCYTMVLYVLVAGSLRFEDEKTNRGSIISML